MPLLPMHKLPNYYSGPRAGSTGATPAGGMNPLTLMLISQGVQGVAGLAGAYSEASAMKAKGRYEKNQMLRNAGFADAAAEDALKRGGYEAGQIQNAAKRLQGSQRAAMGASGLTGGGELLAETHFLGAMDALTVRNNAWREAFGYRVQAEDMRGQAAIAYQASKSNSRNTLISGGLQFAQSALMMGALAGGI